MQTIRKQTVFMTDIIRLQYEPGYTNYIGDVNVGHAKAMQRDNVV